LDIKITELNLVIDDLNQLIVEKSITIRDTTTKLESTINELSLLSSSHSNITEDHRLKMLELENSYKDKLHHQSTTIEALVTGLSFLLTKGTTARFIRIKSVNNK